MNIFLIGLVVCLLTVAYFVLPERIVGGKVEYVKYSLLAVSVWWVICLAYFVLVIQICGMGESLPSANEFSAISLLPCLAVVHQLFPFKAVKRNRTVSFLLWGTVIIGAVVVGLEWLLVQFSNM